MLERWHITAFAFGLLAISFGLVRAATVKTDAPESARYTRACAFASGGWTEVDCSAGAAYSSELTAWTRYIVQCSTNARFAMTTAGSGQDADANDGYIPYGEWVELLTTDSVRYFSCDASGTGGGLCRYIECQ